MRIQLVDTSSRDHLLPLTFTRPVAGLRCGILTVAEKYTRRGHEVGYGTQGYLSKKFPGIEAPEVCIDGGVCPTEGSYKQSLPSKRVKVCARAMRSLHGKELNPRIQVAVPAITSH